MLEQVRLKLWTGEGKFYLTFLSVILKLRIGEWHVVIIANCPALDLVLINTHAFTKLVALFERSVDECLVLTLFANNRNLCCGNTVEPP